MEISHRVHVRNRTSDLHPDASQDGHEQQMGRRIEPFVSSHAQVLQNGIQKQLSRSYTSFARPYTSFTIVGSKIQPIKIKQPPL